MMRLSIAENVSKIDWDKTICSLEGTIFHSSVWVQYTIAGYPRAIPQFITLLSDDGKCLGAALGFEDCSQHKLLAHFTKRLWFDAMPAVRDHDEKLLHEFIQLLERHAQSSGKIRLIIGSYASPYQMNCISDLGFNLTSRFEFELNLDHSEEDLWRGLGDKRRNIIRKAQKMRLSIQDLPGEKGISELHRLQTESAPRILKRGGPDVTTHLRYERDPLRILIESGVGRIVGACIEERVVSANLFTYFNQFVYYTIAAHNQEAFETQAPSLLLWESIKRYKNEGAKKFSLGGCKASAVNESSPEHGIYDFKRKFGAECIQCATGEKILGRKRNWIFEIVKSILHR
jgi:hypothetical protein